MKKHLLAAAVMVLATGSVMAQTNDTLAKIKSSGSITLAVRESSGALAYTLGDGKYVAFHIESDRSRAVLANHHRRVVRIVYPIHPRLYAYTHRIVGSSIHEMA